MIRALALVYRPPGIVPGQRFRLEQWASHLRDKHDISIEFSPFESEKLSSVLHEPGHYASKAIELFASAWRRRDAVRLAREYDVAVIYREASMLGPTVYEHLLVRAGVPIVYDFDDAIWMASQGTVGVNGLFSRLRFPGKTSTICRIASAVTVGNNFLATWARQYSDNVFVVPTSIDLGMYSPQVPLSFEDPFVIGWSGTFSTLRYLDSARNAIEAFARRHRTRVRVIADRPLAAPFRGVEMEFVRWRADQEAAAIGGAHIGIMPLTDEPFAYGKCACKALQYMAAGRPALVSPVGVNSDIITSGKNGILASTDQQWIEALELLRAPDVRARLAAEGRRTVESGFSAEASASLFASAVRHAISRCETLRGPRRPAVSDADFSARP